jgi:GNAT superfamily N-acetyltransferase
MISPEIPDDQLVIVPANEASWDDLEAVLGTVKCHSTRCYCQRFKISAYRWNEIPDEERSHRLREQTGCGQPEAESTSGLVAYLDGEPVGWCSVQPRTAFPNIGNRVPWNGRTEDKTDDSVWTVACFVVRAGHRRQGITYALARATVDFARDRGARALEGYPMLTESGKDIAWGELHVGSRKVFAKAGFLEVSRPTLRRVVMRIDF